MKTFKPGALARIRAALLNPDDTNFVNKIAMSLNASLTMPLEESKDFIIRVFKEYPDEVKSSLTALSIHFPYLATKENPTFRFFLTQIEESGILNQRELREFKETACKDLVLCATYGNVIPNLKLLIEYNYPINTITKGMAPIHVAILKSTSINHEAFDMLFQAKGIRLNLMVDGSDITTNDFAVLFKKLYCANKLKKSVFRSPEIGSLDDKEIAKQSNNIAEKFSRITEFKPEDVEVGVGLLHIFKGLLSDDESVLETQVKKAMVSYKKKINSISETEVYNIARSAFGDDLEQTGGEARASAVHSHVGIDLRLAKTRIDLGTILRDFTIIVSECIRDKFGIAEMLLRYKDLYPTNIKIQLYLLLAKCNDTKIAEYFQEALSLVEKENVNDEMKINLYCEYGAFMKYTDHIEAKLFYNKAIALGSTAGVLGLFLLDPEYVADTKDFLPEQTKHLEIWKDFARLFMAVHKPEKFSALIQNSPFNNPDYVPECTTPLEQVIARTIKAVQALLGKNVDLALSLYDDHVDDMTEVADLMLVYGYAKEAGKFISKASKSGNDKDLALQLQYLKIFIYSQEGRWEEARALWKNVKDVDTAKFKYYGAILQYWKHEIAEILLNNYLSEGLYKKALEVAAYTCFDKEDKEALKDSINQLRSKTEDAIAKSTASLKLAAEAPKALDQLHEVGDVQASATISVPDDLRAPHVNLPLDVSVFLNRIFETSSWGIDGVRQLYFKVKGFLHGKSFIKSLSSEENNLDCVIEGQTYSSQEDGVYKIVGNLFPKHYITIDKGKVFDNTLLEAAKKAIKYGKVVFGLGHNGIKQFGDIIEAKDSSDKHLFTQRKFFDPKTGAYLIILDQVGTHAEIARKVNLKKKPDVIILPYENSENSSVGLDLKNIDEDSSLLAKVEKFYHDEVIALGQNLVDFADI